MTQPQFPPRIATLNDVVNRLQSILDALKNTDSVSIEGITCDVANEGYPVPAIIVPDGMTLVIKAHPENVLLSLIYVSNSKSTSQPHLWPLMPNESMGWRVKSGSALWVSTNVPGSIAVISVERR